MDRRGHGSWAGDYSEYCYVHSVWVSALSCASTTPSFNGGKKAAVVISTAIIFSLLIETLQLILMRGLFEWDDVFSNASGAIAGLLLYSLLSRFKYVPKAVCLVFVITCLVVVITGRNVGGLEADNTSRAYCFQVDSFESTGKEVQ